MCRLYEKFILEYYVQEFGNKIIGFSSKAEQIKWQLDDGDSNLLPIMQTDVTLQYKNKILIIDAKYYERTLQRNFNAHTLHSGNIYQIFTYVKNKEAELKDTNHQISGMLLYAKTDEDFVPDNIYSMSGNKIAVQTLDLNQEFNKIKMKLDSIAENYFKIKKA